MDSKDKEIAKLKNELLDTAHKKYELEKFLAYVMSQVGSVVIDLEQLNSKDFQRVRVQEFDTQNRVRMFYKKDEN